MAEFRRIYGCQGCLKIRQISFPSLLTILNDTQKPQTDIQDTLDAILVIAICPTDYISDGRGGNGDQPHFTPLADQTCCVTNRYIFLVLKQNSPDNNTLIKVSYSRSKSVTWIYCGVLPSNTRRINYGIIMNIKIRSMDFIDIYPLRKLRARKYS
jgi:hypothetical protein